MEVAAHAWLEFAQLQCERKPQRCSGFCPNVVEPGWTGAYFLSSSYLGDTGPVVRIDPDGSAWHEEKQVCADVISVPLEQRPHLCDFLCADDPQYELAQDVARLPRSLGEALRAAGLVFPVGSRVTGPHARGTALADERHVQIQLPAGHAPRQHALDHGWLLDARADHPAPGPYRPRTKMLALKLWCRQHQRDATEAELMDKSYLPNGWQWNGQAMPQWSELVEQLEDFEFLHR